jgi:F-type H+-transporting ATPase subunit b
LKRAAGIIAQALFVLAAAGLAFASGGGEEPHGLPWGNYLYRVVNFIVVAFLIWKFAGAKIKDMFKGRRSQIKRDLDELEVRQGEAEKRLKDVERSIAGLEQEKQAILEEAKRQGEDLKRAIVEKANRDAELIKTQAKKSAEFEAKAALDGLRNEMADLIVAAATKIVQEKLSEKDHEKLVDDYLTKVVLN